jgi:uncharacterized protein
MAGKFVLKGSGDQLMFDLLASGTSEVLLTSTRHAHKASALEGIASARFSAPFEAQYLRMTSSTGEAYFVLHAGNNEVIGTSAMYPSWRAREEAIAVVKANAPGASVIDRTETTEKMEMRRAVLHPRASRRSA